MARNLKRDYLKKLLSIETKNGYTVDIDNYIYNPSFNNEYPNLSKKISETEKTETIRYYRYFKHYDGMGKYEFEDIVFDKEKNDTGWRTSTNSKRTIIMDGVKRFSMKKLIELAEADE